ncbi:MAG: phosphoenolpyruvate--protein phosphotransferase [Candidatus Zixiibacteriota bacterium]|nr:MAG: phosphoenolpyruvate--protein phosphotransferase [candidate division Zixibacteria bacterium]
MIARGRKTILRGLPAAPGLTLGEARVVYSLEQTIEERVITPDQVEHELMRLDMAVAESLTELESLKESASRKISGPVARIFESQFMIADDREFLKNVKAEIASQLKAAEYIYSLMVEKAVAPLRASRDQYMRQMVVDIEAVSNRILRRLTGQAARHIGQAPQESIFVGKIFSPAEVMNLYERKVRAIVTTAGGVNSHMALIARSLLIPTVVGIPQAHLKIMSGDRLIVDGDKGTVTINPSLDEWNQVRKKKARVTALQILKLDKLPDFPPRTADNIDIDVAANYDVPGPIDRILADHKVGIGLYRTEFIYLQNGRFPSEDDQYRLYNSVAKVHYPRPVTIRTFDLGSDKYHPSDSNMKENNPALGWRGIRASFDMPNVFKDQVKAILRASKRGNVKMLLPMIADITELRKAGRIIRHAMAELRKSNLPFDRNIQIGIMIEVPSAAVAADILAEKVSFFSIGSNDLTQYTLAADRDNQKLAKIFNPLHPAVLRLIRMTIEAAQKNNIPVAVCGEMSGDILSIPLLIGMGISQLSMNPSRLYNACRLIPKIKYSDAVKIAKEVSRLKTLKEIEGFLLNYNMSVE